METQEKIRGKVWKFGDCLDSGNINGVMAGVDPDFHKKVRPRDIIVAGINFGMGSSSEHAPRSLRDAGISAVIAESISSIYLRTLINLGLPAIECPGISQFVDQGDELEIDLRSGKIKNLQNGQEKSFPPFSDYAIGILCKGGLIPYLRGTLGRALSLFLGMSLLALLQGSAWAQTESLEKLIEGAKKEGGIVYYTSTSGPEALEMVRAFEKKYPFIKVSHYRAGSDTLMEKILIETRAGRYNADVYNMRSFTNSILVQKGLLAKYPSPHSRFYPDGFKDPEGRWTSFYMNPATIGYNTRLVPPSQAPKDWPDLLDPKWKGQMIMDREESEWFANMLKVMGREKGLEFMRKLAAQNLTFRVGHTLLAQLVAAGEFKVGVVLYSPRIERMKSTGAPIEWVRAKPVIAYHYSISVASHAPHPNAARLFVDYFLSKEGQDLIVKIAGRVPVRVDAKADPAHLVEGVNLVASDSSLAEKDFKGYFDEYRRVFNVQ